MSLGTRAVVEFYPLKNFRRYAQTTKILLHEKRTPENFTTRKFPDLRYIKPTNTQQYVSSAHPPKTGRDLIKGKLHAPLP